MVTVTLFFAMSNYNVHIDGGDYVLKLTEAQIEQAWEVDLLSYLQIHAPHSIRKFGENEYCLFAHMVSVGKTYCIIWSK